MAIWFFKAKNPYHGWLDLGVHSGCGAIGHTIDPDAASDGDDAWCSNLSWGMSQDMRD